MKKVIVLFLFAFLIENNSLIGQEISIGIRGSLRSEILDSERPYSVYLPPSYYKNEKAQYPILYILDGDYNFRYVTGLIELQSSISENIPEMIVVGISGKGSTRYRKNCKPEIEGIEDSGNADQVLAFIEKELIPHISSNYRANQFKILAGHSLGGLFVINASLKKPALFNNYIAISPSLWWADNSINKIAQEKYQNKTKHRTSTYVSLADEEGMGVEEFLLLVNSDYTFKQFENESHNSVGEPTYKWALNEIFKEWKVNVRYFESANELLIYTHKMDSIFSVDFAIPNGILYVSVLYVLSEKEKELSDIKQIIKGNYPFSYAYYNSLLATIYINNKELEKADRLINKIMIEDPNSIDLYQKSAEIKFLKMEYSKADSAIDLAIRLAREQKVRQWELNELIEQKEEIKLKK